MIEWVVIALGLAVGCLGVSAWRLQRHVDRELDEVRADIEGLGRALAEAQDGATGVGDRGLG